MSLDINSINRETNVSEDEELRRIQRQRLHKITAEELKRSEHLGVNARMQSIDNFAPNVANACFIIPPAVKNFWQASSQAYIHDMMGTWVTEDNNTWRHADGAERPDDTSDS